MNRSEWKAFEKKLDAAEHELKLFASVVEGFFRDNPSLKEGDHGKIHSTRLRLKERSHIKEKIVRKSVGDRAITPDNLFSEITDLAGVRLLLLFQSDFSAIDAAIREKVALGDWVLGETPKAFTWDPENTDYFSTFDLEVQSRETAYTSVHYLIKPKAGSHLCCEVQVRTLFEEIWGEVDHRLNYPKTTLNVSCREQLKVLSKLSGAGSRLLDSIQRSMRK